MTRLHLTSPLDEVMGWTVDYGDVKQLFKPVYNQIDHHLLNEISDLPDGNIAEFLRWMRSHVGDALPQMDRIDMYETPGSGAMLSWGELGPALPT